jgi:TonB family protein
MLGWRPCRISASQAEGCRFETRLPLTILKRSCAGPHVEFRDMLAFRTRRPSLDTLIVWLIVAFAALVAFSATAASARADCNVAITNERVIGSDPTRNTFVYGFDLASADGKPLDAKLIAFDSNGTRRPARVAGKYEWDGLAFSLPANVVTSMLLIAEPAPAADETAACPGQKIDLKSVQTDQNGSWPIGASDPGMIDLPASMVPAAGAVVPLEVRDAHCSVCKPPKYPQFALFDRRTGRIDIGATIAADGTAGGFTVLASSGFADLDNEALATARSSSFVAATVNGIPVVGQMVIVYEFKIGR